jgi:hypothetical protein
MPRFIPTPDEVSCEVAFHHCDGINTQTRTFSRRTGDVS